MHSPLHNGPAQVGAHYAISCVVLKKLQKRIEAGEISLRQSLTAAQKKCKKNLKSHHWLSKAPRFFHLPKEGKLQHPVHISNWST